MTDISGLTAPSTSTVVPASTTPTVSSRNDQLGADTFLQLLVAQLKYQDPTDPASSTEFLAQTAQFTMVEKLTQIAEQTELARQTDANIAAATLVGRTVEYLQPDGTAGRGTVSAARLGSAGPVLVVGGVDVAFDRVTQVTAGSTTTTTTTPPAPTTSSTSTTPPTSTTTV